MLKPSFIAYEIKKEYEQKTIHDRNVIKLYSLKIIANIKFLVLHITRLTYYLFKLIFDLF